METQILLSINGNRKIPLDIPAEVMEKITQGANQEVKIVLVATPTGLETIYDDDGKVSTIAKVKINYIEQIT